ncbi:MAG: S8 family serine peptidase, partial [Acidimicrobiia bacterium]|nr:S8 family serine peptidase [Acidimicrobiia bacterium]
MSTEWVRVEGVTWQTSKRDQLIALVAALALLMAVVASIAPASAGKGGSWTPPSGMFGSEIAWRTGVEPMWDLGYTGAGIDVAVIDTGVNAVQGLDGRGKIIDGPDFSFDADDANLRYRDLYGHGTAMASLVAGATPKGSTLGSDNLAVGMAPGARIVNVKVGDGVGAVDVSQVIAAIDWVVQHRNANGMNVRVMLLAFDTDSTQGYLLDPLAYAVENAWHHGITVVVSAGNDGKSAQTLGNPATDPYVLAVAAAARGIGSAYRVPTWASSGDGIRNPDLAMPGEQILAAAVPGSYLAQANPGAVFDTPQGKVIRGNGTSQAAALAAGAAATLLEARPELTPDEVKAALTTTARDIGTPAKFMGGGLLDLHPALDANVAGATQTHPRATGLGTLEKARGSYHIGPDGNKLTGETTAFGDTWNPSAWKTATSQAAAYTNSTFNNSGSWTGSWLGATWSGATWSGATWSGATWSGATWSGATWSGAT